MSSSATSTAPRARRPSPRIEAAGGKAALRDCDVTEDGQIAALVQTAVTETGKLDIMVNNAAIAIGGMPVHEMTGEQWHKLIATNLSQRVLGLQVRPAAHARGEIRK